MHDAEILISAMDLAICHDLNLGSAAIQIIEHQISTLFSDVGDSTGHRHSLFRKTAFFCNGCLVFLDKLMDLQLYLEFVRVAQLRRLSFQFRDRVAAVFVIFARVNDFLRFTCFLFFRL